MKLTGQHFFIILFGLIIGYITYKIFKQIRDNDTDDIENFESSINKFIRKKNNNKKSNKSNNSNNSKNHKISKVSKTSNTNNSSNTDKTSNINKSKSNFANLSSDSGITFDELIGKTEKMNLKKYSITNVKDDILDYLDSFKKEKFRNETGSSNEYLDQLGYFKDKFFEIFI